MTKYNQLAVEAKQHKSAFKAKIKHMLDGNNNVISQLGNDLDKFIESMKDIDSVHSEYHYSLMSGLKKNRYRIVEQLLKTLLFDESLRGEHNYLDLDALSIKLGQKVCNKEHSKYHDLVLTVGLNIFEWADGLFLDIVGKRLDNKHYVYTVVTTKLEPVLNELAGYKWIDLSQLRIWALDVRASGPMTSKPVAHTGGVGGHLSNGRTFLNQSLKYTDQDCEPLTKLQDVPFMVREYDWLINEHLDSDIFYNKLVELKREKSKFLDDYERVKGNKFWIPMALDYRIRMYSKSHYINTQGTTTHKAMLEFYNKEILTDFGLKELALKAEEESGNAIGRVLAEDLEKAKLGMPVGSICSYDATNSVMQMFCLLMGDESLLLGDHRLRLIEWLKDKLGIDDIPKEAIKYAFMIYLYGGKNPSVVFDIKHEKSDINLVDLAPDDLTMDELFAIFEEGMLAVAPGAVKTMELIYAFLDEDQIDYEFMMPDGMIVHYKATHMATHKGYRLSRDGKTHQGSINIETDGFDKKGGRLLDRGLAPNIIHALDAFIMRMVIMMSDFDIMAIHDSFGIIPNHKNELFANYIAACKGVLEMDLLFEILHQLNPEKAKRAKRKGMLDKGNLKSEDLLNIELLA